MTLLGDLALVFVAGLVTALATGIGALPFFFVDEFSDRWNVGLWGIASGIMLTVSVFGLVDEGLAYASEPFPTLMVAGLSAGVLLVVVSDRVLDGVDLSAHGGADDGAVRVDDDADDHNAAPGHDHDADSGPGHDAADLDGDADSGHGHDELALEAQAFAEGDLKKLVLILGVLTVHSFPEGVAVGVSFAELGLDGGVSFLGFSIPLLAVFMTVAISVHNIPEGTAIAIPMRAMGLSNWRMVGAAVFSSLPQPVGAVVAFVFVSWAESFLPFGYGFAAGAMVYLVLAEFIPEALESGAELPGRGYRELLAGLAAGVIAMLPVVAV